MKINHIFYTTALFLCVGLHLESNTFDRAKEELRAFYFYNTQYRFDFYCQAPFKVEPKSDLSGFKTPEIVESSTYTPSTKSNKKSKIIEFEHIVPASAFGKHLSCWSEVSKKGKKGRANCQDTQNTSKDAQLFNQMESDVLNIVPAIGEINASRSTFEYFDAPQDLQFSQYGNCKVFVDSKNKRFYPAPYSKGYIARSYLYMIETYFIPNDLPYDKEEFARMQKWDKLYPQDSAEKALRERLWQINKKLKAKEIIKDIDKKLRLLQGLI